MTDPAFLRVAPLADLPPNTMRAFAIGERSVLVCHAKDGVYALDNLCTHGEARLDEGRLRGVRLICPLHGASFDCRSGAVLGAPATQPLTCHATRIVDGWVEVALAG